MRWYRLGHAEFQLELQKPEMLLDEAEKRIIDRVRDDPKSRKQYFAKKLTNYVFERIWDLFDYSVS